MNTKEPIERLTEKTVRFSERFGTTALTLHDLDMRSRVPGFSEEIKAAPKGFALHTNPARNKDRKLMAKSGKRQFKKKLREFRAAQKEAKP